MLYLFFLKPGESNYWNAERRHKYQPPHKQAAQATRRAEVDTQIGFQRRMQNKNCPKHEFYMTCDQYFFAIWDQDGKWVYDSYLYGTEYSECYDPNACYLYEIVSESGDCQYKIVMDGQTVKSGKVVYNPDGSSLVVRAGQCEEQCPGQHELVILSYIEYGDIDYILHMAGGGDEEGLIIEGDAKSFCIEPGACSVIVRTTLGWSFYFVLGAGEEVIDMGGFEKTQTFGECMSECEDVTLLMSTNERDGGLNISMTTDGIVEYDNTLQPGQEANICIDTSKCNILDGKGQAYYYFFRDGEVYDRGFTPEYRLFGPCDTICMGRPVLATTQRGQDIVTRLSTVSGMRELADFNSERYQAACWLVNDDLKQLEANDPKLLQRYILAVIYLTTGGPNWEAQLSFMGGKDECVWEAVKCNEEKFVTYLYLGFNNLQGTLASEIFSLIHLDFFDITRNVFTGTIPNGLSRLPMKYLDIYENTFTGTLPSDFFKVDNIEYMSVGRNLISGTIPSDHKDLSKVTELWFQNNFISGTLPQWFQEITALKNLFFHFNKLTGKMPDYNLPNLRQYWLWDNAITGTLPPTVFMLPSLRELKITKNKFSGPIVLPENFERSLLVLQINDNEFTGTLPSEIAQLNKLQQVLVNDNKFSGTFPQEWGKLKKAFNLRLENNNVTGTIPYKNCKDFAVLSADCSAPISMECECCTRCFGIFTTYEDVLECPSSIMSLKYYSKTNDKITFSVENLVPQLVAANFEYTRFAANDFDFCISPTDCLTLQSQSDPSFDIAVDGNVIFEDLKGFGTQVKFGYASDGTMKPRTCDDYIICNRAIRAKTPQRRLVNLLTRISGLDIFGGQQSNQYDSLCWWLNDLDRLSESELESTVLVQRYFLALLYNSNGGDNWINRQNWMSSAPECEWYGVSCDTYEKVISTIDLSNNNLVGSIPKEMGEIRGLEHLILSGNNIGGNIPLRIVQLNLLKTLDLSSNKIDGTIPPEFKFLESLEDLNLETNRITSTIPSEISLIRNLRSVNLGKNALSGGLPPEIKDLLELKSLSLDSNLMAGELQMLADLTQLEYVDFSNNYFEGSLPLFGSKQRNLHVANFNNNQFSGAIPGGVEDLTGMNELMAYGNDLTGSLPSQLGLLTNITKISFAYNLLKGTVPSELSNMKQLELLHLHSNSLVGDSDLFDYKIASYITDCGSTETSDGLTECLDCTECCNVDGDCITTEETWPRNYVKKLNIRPSALVVLFAIVFSLVLMALCTVFSVFSKNLPRLSYVVRQEFQQDSAYRWFLSSSKLAWFFAVISVMFQTWIIITFLEAGDFSYAGNLWLYSKDCPDDDTVCYQQKTTDIYGWLTFTAILAVFLLQDFIPGALIFYESSVEFSLKGIFAGITLLNITILSTVASTIFIYATSISNIAIIKDAVIVLFLNSIDEQVFMIVQRVAPGWTDDVEVDIMNFTLDKLTQEISEVIDDEDGHSAYAPSYEGGKDVDVKDMFDTDGFVDDDDGYNGDYIEGQAQDDYDNYAENNYNGYDEHDKSNDANQVDFETMKQELVSEVMGIYDADKAKFMAAHEADKARILEELNQVKRESAALKGEINAGK